MSALITVISNHKTSTLAVGELGFQIRATICSSNKSYMRLLLCILLPSPTVQPYGAGLLPSPKALGWVLGTR